MPTMRDGSFEQHGQAFGSGFQRGNMQRCGHGFVYVLKSEARIHSIIAMFYLALELPLAPRLCTLLRLDTVKSCFRT